MAHRPGQHHLIERRAPGRRRHPGSQGTPGSHPDPVDGGGPAVTTGAARPGQLRTRHRRRRRTRPRHRPGLPDGPRAGHLPGSSRHRRRTTPSGGTPGPGRAGRRAVQRAGAGSLRDVRCGRLPRRRRGDLPSPGRHPTGHRVGRGPQQNPDPTGSGGPARRSPAPADRRPPDQRRNATGRCGPPSGGPTTCSPDPSRSSFGGCRSSPGRSTSPPPAALPPIPRPPPTMWTSAMVDDLLGELVERSMLLVDSGRFGRRFRLLETIREFAAEQLAADDDAALIAGRHAQWCLHQVTDIHRLLVGPAEAEGVARLAELWPNLRAGFDWACTTGDRELADALVRPDCRGGQPAPADRDQRLGRADPRPHAADGQRTTSPSGWCASPTGASRAETTTGTRGSSTATATPTIRWSATPAPTSTMTATGSRSAPPTRWPGSAATAQDYAAELAETGGVAAGLMNTGRLRRTR